MGVLSVFRIASSALTAQRLRLDVTASNIANAETTSTPEGGPYRRTSVVFAPLRDSSARRPAPLGASASGPGFDGVAIRGIVRDQTPPRQVYDPTHPDADESGEVSYPNVDLVTETADMLAASRAYEANVTIINVAKSMAQRAIDIGRA
jgi:flagellar basal-body rod protein FlgC